MAKVNVHEAKTNFSKLLVRIAKGEEVVICRSGKPVARLVPMAHGAIKRIPGSAKGKVIISDDFHALLPRAILASFER